MALNLANVVSTDTFQTWLDRTNQIIERASNTAPLLLDFQGSNHDSLDAQEGRVYFDNTHKSLTVFSEGGLEMELGQNEYIRVYNNSSDAINLGQPLFLNGSTAGVPNAQLANASDATRYNISGLAANSIPIGTYGWAAVSGALRGFDTSGLTQGQRFFVSATANGALVTTPPTYPNYPMCVGLCVVSDSANGIVVIEQQNHSVPSFRVINNAYVGGDITIKGDLNVLGAETITTLSNLQVDDTFVYLNGGDTVVANTALVTGINDLTFKGHYNGGNNVTFYVKIDSTGVGADKFSWSLDNFSTTEAANVDITTAQQTLRWGISVQFEANTGHTAGDIWTGAAAPLNLDTGWASNRNPGHAAGGYTHLGMFLDASDTRFKVFQSYRPSVAGTINVSDPSFEYGLVQANTFYSTGSGQIIIPTGNTNQRASDTLGSLRYNTEDGQFEGYGAEGWGQIGGGGLGKFLFKKANYTASSGDRIAANTVGGGFTVTLPGVPAADDIVEIIDENNTFNTGNLTVDRNGQTIENVADNLVADISGTNFYCQYDGTTWRVFGLATGTQYFEGTLSVNALDVTESVTANTGAFTGQVSAQDFNSTSDIAFKQDVSTITDASSLINKLRGVSFKWKNNQEPSYGLVAQELESVIPNLVTKNVDGTKSVKYNGLIGFLIESNKQLQQRIEALEQKLQDK
jgi:hypothetical protein